MAEQLIRYSRDCAEQLLEHVCPDAWLRSQTAARHAEGAATALGRPRAEIITAAAWLHAIGESPDLTRSGLAPLDGALHLLTSGWPEPVVSLVAHQMQSRLVAGAFASYESLGLIERIQGWPSDIMDYAVVISLAPAGLADPEMGLRRASESLPTTLRITARDRAERDRRIRRAVDRVSAALISTGATAPL